MRILLITLPKEEEVVESNTPDYLLYDFANYPPSALMAIAADVNPRHSIKILDSATKNMSIKEVVDYIRRFQPDVLGITVSSRRLWPLYTITKQIKESEPHITIVAGGPHIDEFGMSAMELGTFDFGMSGYCERTFPKFIEALDKVKNGADEEVEFSPIPGIYFRLKEKIHFNEEETKPQNLDDFPFPQRELVDLDDYYTAADMKKMTTMYTSRGCPYKCTFCDVLEKKYHFRSAKKIVDEMEYIVSLGIQEIHIFDDTFNLNKKRVIEMCEEIIKRGLKISWTSRVRADPFDREMLTIMKKSGCVRLHVGVESLNPVSLENMKKQITLQHLKDFFILCNELKINTLAYFIIGFPEEDEAYWDSFYKTLTSMKPTYIYLNVLYPLAKTQLYQDTMDNLYHRDHWTEFFNNPTPNYQLPLSRTPELQDKLVGLMDQVHKKFYLSPRFIVSDLMRNTSSKMLFRKAKLAVRMVFADSRSKMMNTTSHHSAPYVTQRETSQ